ncbi:MAG: hypothetical protein K6B69_15340 [Lachnospiraceae bacterium]|nr:hypothetical protein [Lachnospiraceae bacterium]
MGKIDVSRNAPFRSRKDVDLFSWIEKIILRTILFFTWLVLLVMGIGVFVLGIIGLFYFLREQSVPGMAAGLFFIPGGGLFIGWTLSLLGPLFGYFAFKIDLRYAAKRKKYDPQKVIRELAQNYRCNVVLINNEQGWMRLYGIGEEFVLEIGIHKDDGDRIFHMIDPANRIETDTIMPLTDDIPVMIKNNFHEYYAVRKSRVITQRLACVFLEKLYECKDLEKAMTGMAFIDTTKETRRLIEEDAYLVPEVPVDDPPGRQKKYIAWIQSRKECAEHAMKVMQSMDEGGNDL